MERQRLKEASGQPLKCGVYVDSDGYKAVLDMPDGQVTERAFSGKYMAGVSYRKMAVSWLEKEGRKAWGDEWKHRRRVNVNYFPSGV